MKILPKEQWRQKWNDRDLKEILNIARGLRTQGAPSDRAAWYTAEELYLGRGQRASLRGQLYG